MRITNWTAPRSVEERKVMTGRRAAHNRRRARARLLRQYKLLQLVRVHGLTSRGWHSQAAQALGVTRETISRDLSAMFRTGAAEQWARDRFPLLPLLRW